MKEKYRPLWKNSAHSSRSLEAVDRSDKAGGLYNGETAGDPPDSSRGVAPGVPGESLAVSGEDIIEVSEACWGSESGCWLRCGAAGIRPSMWERLNLEACWSLEERRAKQRARWSMKKLGAANLG